MFRWSHQWASGSHIFGLKLGNSMGNLLNTPKGLGIFYSFDMDIKILKKISFFRVILPKLDFVTFNFLFSRMVSFFHSYELLHRGCNDKESLVVAAKL
jgi:hypothetical protein